ncbi:Hint domain-containing protein [Nioella ostreopsis]|uniref:Hint domain-containing protein n=1 Tax=Nioella ostreopsis TaxID=2448479 RepID=UPI000FD747E3|nr:Hint domain-containing protein [Nioella ostreopsis]
MAVYTFDYSLSYNPQDLTPSNTGFAVPAPGTLSDGDADLPGTGEFQVGESITYTYGTGTTETLLMRGTVEINGVTFVVLEKSPISYYAFGMTGEPSTFGPISFVPPSSLSSLSFPVCFCEGTQIATPERECAVEDLQIGDMVLTAKGDATPVKWIGRQTVATRFGPAERLMPVRFAAGSLGEGLPHADLTVTADHGMLVDGVICHAGALVNGTTITRVPLSEMGETYTVYHIETEDHEIILANGAPAETFIDNVSRRAFDNYAEFEALYGDVPEMEELPYPRAMSARQVPGRIRHKLSTANAA